MKIYKLLFAVLVVAWTGSAFSPASYGGSTYHGTVIDAETKAPLEGAVVVVIWYKKPLITMDGPTYLHKVTEALTDAEGKFTVDASSGMNWNPFRRVLKDPERDPSITVFKPGYGPFPVAQVHPTSVMKGREAMLGDGAVVELPKMKTAEDLMRFVDGIHMGVSSSIPPDRIPNFIRLINLQRENLGLKPFPSSYNPGQNP